jgi:Rieske Fe-S protein
VTLTKDEAGWVCKAHGSRFEVDGALNFGPATIDLPAVPVKVSKGLLTIG